MSLRVSRETTEGVDLFAYAERARDEGMRRAANHADRTIPAWTDSAYSFLLAFARSHELFISEDVSNASKVQGFPQPPTDRAWGAVYRRAVKAGVIIQDGFGRSVRRHASICPRWRSQIHRGQQ